MAGGGGCPSLEVWEAVSPGLSLSCQESNMMWFSWALAGSVLRTDGGETREETGRLGGGIDVGAARDAV